MPYLEHAATTIYYEDHGTGFPLLALAPGGMVSTVEFWANATIDPLREYRDDFRIIAMDQRNAGQSRGPLDLDDPWGAYARDQLALVDHLGLDTFHVMGCCIGGAFILKLLELAPARVVAAVLEQPIGIRNNGALFDGMWRKWAEPLLATRPDLDQATLVAFGSRMWDDAEFVPGVTRDTVRAIDVPMLVLPGIDDYHPTAVGREIAALAPQGEVFEPWKDTPEHVAEGIAAIRNFLQRHTPQA